MMRKLFQDLFLVHCQSSIGGGEQDIRWHQPALPTTLAKLATISATTLARLVLCTQQRCKEVPSAVALRQVVRRRGLPTFHMVR